MSMLIKKCSINNRVVYLAVNTLYTIKLSKIATEHGNNRILDNYPFNFKHPQI